jgi:hypothetical protein
MRTIRLSLLLLLLMAVGVTAAQPVPTTDLSSLARYYEEDALVFASIRTDEAFFQEIDTLADRVIGFLPESERPEMGLLDSLNQELQAETGQTLDEAIFPWLGDTAAIGIPALMPENLDQNDAPFYAAFDIDDPAAARAYLENVTDDATITEQNGFTLIEGMDGNLIAIGTDVLFLSTTEYNNMLPLSGVASPLSEDAAFTDTLGQLPADGYNALAYINTGQLQQEIFAAAEAEGEDIPGLLMQLSNATLGQAFGATIQGDSALTLDVVQVIDTAIYDEFGLEIYRPGAVDLNFASRIPADAPLVIHGADFGSSLQASLDMLRTFGDYLQENETLADLTETGQDVPLSPTERALLNNVDPAWLLGAFNSTFAGFTGLSFERDVLTTLDSDAALYLRVIPSEGFPLLPVTPDFAAIFQTSDPAANAEFVQSLVDAFAAYDLDYATESYGDGQAIVVDELTRQLGMEPVPQFDVLIGGSDSVFALGTRRAVEAALDTSGGLAATDAFSTASQSLLPEPTNVWYLGTDPLFALLDTLLQQGVVTPADLDDDGRAFLRLASIIESATVSTQSPAEGIGVSRAVLNFGTEPYVFPAVGQAAVPGASN